MTYRWIGAVMVMISCGGCGFAMAARYIKEVRTVRNLGRIAEYMITELQYSLMPLPDLCQRVSEECSGGLKRIFSDLSRELETQVLPDAASCMRKILDHNPELPRDTRHLLLRMGRTLGGFDLPGQISELRSLQAACEIILQNLESNREIRIRNYRTLGLCTGAALVILFL